MTKATHPLDGGVELKSKWLKDEQHKKRVLHNSKCRSIYDKSHPWLRWTFRFMWPLSGQVHELQTLKSEHFDNYAPCSCLVQEASKHLALEWLAATQEEQQKEKAKQNRHRHHLLRCIGRTYARHILAICLLLLLSDCLCEPLYFYLSARLIRVIGQFPGGTLASTGNGTTTTTTATTTIAPDQLIGELYTCASAFIVFLACGQLLSHPYSWLVAKVTLKLRVALCDLLYKKALRLSLLRASNEANVHYKQAMSLISRDLEQLDGNTNQLAWVLSAPIQCFALTLILIQALDWPTAMLALAFNGLVAIQRAKMNFSKRTWTRAASSCADRRVNLISETLNGIRIVRMHAWTEALEHKIGVARSEELEKRSMSVYLNCLDTALFFITCSASAIATLVFGHFVRGIPITQAFITQVFLVSAIYRRSMSRYLPQGVLSWTNVLIILNRCEAYLLAPELDSAAGSVAMSACTANGDLCSMKIIEHNNKQLNETPLVELQQVCFAWPLTFNERHATTQTTNGQLKRCLEGVNLTIRAGQLCLIAGRVGAGKSTLLQLLLGELQPQSGTIKFAHDTATRIAYAPQEAWIFAGSVRDNILFGGSLNVTRYMQVLRACSLVPDLCSFPDFDRTRVGERGVTLSGGQKARISLARCLYQVADLYLLDDPLSAVDAHVASNIFRHALRGFLAQKAVICVTHQTQYLKEADTILYLLPCGDSEHHAAYTTYFGTYDELQRQHHQNKWFTDHHDGHQSPLPPVDQLLLLDDKTNHSATSDDFILGRILSSQLDKSSMTMRPITNNQTNSTNDDELVELRTQKSDLTRALGFYLSNAGAPPKYVTFFLFNILCRFLFIGLNIWLNTWASFETDPRRHNDQLELVTPNNWTDFVARLQLTQLVYSALGVWLCLVCVACLRSYQFYQIVMRASRSVHSRLVAALLNAQMYFFDSTPAGHLLNRVSADVSHMDTTFVTQLDDLSLSGLSVTFILLSIGVSQPNILAGVLLVIVCACALIKRLARLTSSLKHLDGHRRAAIYSHVATTLDGLPVIRAAQKQDVFIQQYAYLLDKHTSVRFLNVSLRRFIINSLDFIIVAFFVTLLTMDVIDTLNGRGMYAFVGLNLIVQLTRICQLTFSRFVEFYTTIQSIDRLRDYTLNLCHERNQLQPHDTPPPPKVMSHWLPIDNSKLCLGATKSSDEVDWWCPTKGKISFSGVSLKYSMSPSLVLDNLSFCIEAGESVGIVGRTGAGKSSLATVLFHLYHFEGFIHIDGQNTKELPLNVLRRSLGIIPQDPVLFSGTIRYNLDPFNEFDDAQIWRSLEVVQLKQIIGTSLNALVTNSGANFSLGQRQLICLARAILRRNKILILDEATANVDRHTDSLIQMAIQCEFKHCTVLTIAHRLNTIVHTNRVMVMHEGRVCEFDKPSVLIERDTSLFRQMIESTGSQQAAILKRAIHSAASKVEWQEKVEDG